MKKIPPPVRSAVATQAKVGQVTVDRFLAGQRVPRGRELDQMVTAVALVGEAEWTDPWKDAVARAEAAKVEWSRYLSGELPIAPDQPSGEQAGERRRPPRR